MRHETHIIKGRDSMKLKSIRAYGFKSFADKIDIEFKSNITAIVGPNGSGKSNIVDAIRWVLGSQSVKALRGASSMSDVIFAGSETRSPFKRAEVSLVFDNKEHFLNTELEDVEVKRILYHTGENEYYINNRKVRLKDITDLLLDSGIGENAFNIISQGSIESIVNSKPVDRRVLLESAASVLKYKTRKMESVKKLEKTKDNLEKVSLVTDELSLSVLPLKEQAEVAKKYLKMKEELEGLEISLTTHDITMIHDNYNALLREIKELEEKKELLEFHSNKGNADSESLRLEMVKIEEQLNEANDKLILLNEELSKIVSEKTLLQERQKYTVDTSKVDENLLMYKEQEIALQKELELAKDDLQRITANLQESKKYLSDTEEAYSILNIKRKHLESEMESVNRNHFVLVNKINLLEANMEQDLSLPTSVKNVLNHPRLEGIRGTIGKLIEVSEMYTTAIDVALGASANFIVTETEEDAKKAIEFLKTNRLGRATFFPMNVIKPRFIPSHELDVLKSQKGYLGIASDLVRYEGEYEAIIKNQLGQVIVSDSMDSMSAIGALLNYKYRVVSLDGEILHAGGSLSGGSLKKQNSTLKDRQELQSLKQELENNEHSMKSLEDKRKKMDLEKEKFTSVITEYEKKVFHEKEMWTQKEKEKNIFEVKLQETANNLKNAHALKEGSLEAELIKNMNLQKEKEVEKEILEKKIASLRAKKSDLSSQVAHLDAEYREKNSEYHKVEAELKRLEIEVGKQDTKMDYLLGILNDEYHMTYEKAKMDYVLDLEVDVARSKVSRLKKDLQSLGEVNLGSISEYERVSERYDFLMEQKSDLEKSCEELFHIIDEMDEIMKVRLQDAFSKIQTEFSIVFKKMFKGGVGMLKLTDPNNILETGIEIIAEPPGKKLNNIGLLSGGEKTLTAISLLFAILNVYPVPFCVLDEVEAALDEANVDTFGAYLQEQKEKSEFILITHKKRTMEYATTLYGITMQEQGVSKIVSVSLADSGV